MILHLLYQLKYDMNQIQSWLSANKRTLNVKKKSVLIGSYYKLSLLQVISQLKWKTPQHQYLGVHIDESLRWLWALPWKLLQRKYLLVLQFWNACVSPFIPFDARIGMYNAFQWCLASIIVVRSGEILVSWNLDRIYFIYLFPSFT